jgi:hypothetical protein
VSKRTETHGIEEIHSHEEYYDRRQISFLTGHFGSRQALEFLLCESYYWFASYLAPKIKPITECPTSDNNKIKCCH